MARMAGPSVAADGRRCTAPPSASRTSASQCWGYRAGSVTWIERVEAVQRIDQVADLGDGPGDGHRVLHVPPLVDRRLAVGHVRRQGETWAGGRGDIQPALRQRRRRVDIP